MDAHILLSPVGQKNRNKIQLSSHRKQKISGNGWNAFHRLRTPSTVCGLLPPLRRSPSLEEGGRGVSPVKASGLAVDGI